MRYVLLIGVLTWTVISSMNAAEADDEGTSLATMLNKFTPNFLKAVGEVYQSNMICSPLSAWITLSLVAFGARENTKSQMRTALILPEDKDDIQKAGFVSKFIANLKNSKSVELYMASQIFLNDGVEPKAEFNEIAQEGFGSIVDNVNFAEPNKASKTINDWCEKVTKGKIKDLVKPDSLNGNTAMVLANAIYFKGQWNVSFNSANTKERPFKIDETRTINVPTMSRTGLYKYGRLRNAKASGVVIPYLESVNKDDQVNMVVMVPFQVDGIDKLKKNIDQESLKDVFVDDPELVYVQMPKFTIESELNLQLPLEKMGMTEMFSDKADFTGIVDKPALKVSSIVQKAFIEVNEQGSEATVSTTAQMESRDGPMRVVADHPFLIYITLGKDYIPIFTATYTGETKSVLNVVREPVNKPVQPDIPIPNQYPIRNQYPVFQEENPSPPRFSIFERISEKVHETGDRIKDFGERFRPRFLQF